MRVSIVQICLRPRFEDQGHLPEAASLALAILVVTCRSIDHSPIHPLRLEPETGSDPAAYRPARITL